MPRFLKARESHQENLAFPKGSHFTAFCLLKISKLLALLDSLLPCSLHASVWFPSMPPMCCLCCLWRAVTRNFTLRVRVWVSRKKHLTLRYGLEYLCTVKCAPGVTYFY